MNCQRLNASFLTGTFALLFAICCGQAFAQVSGGSYTINKSAVVGGGGTSTNGTTQITGTAGQRATRTLSDGTNTIASGFWLGVNCTFSNSGGNVITPATLPNGTTGQSYSQTLVGNGSIGPYTFLITAGAVPAGMSLGSFGVLSGTPSAAGTSNFTVTVTDGFGCTATQSFSLTITGCPTFFTVNDLGDTSEASAGDGICADSNGKCTLRAAIQEANAITVCSPLTINFSVTGTINLATVLPDSNHPNLTISGPGASNLTVQRSTAPGTGNFRIFRISVGKTANISGLRLANGFSTGNAGAISNGGTLSLSDCVLSGNDSNNQAGGIYTTGPLTVTRCNISDNTADNGGGIAAFSTTLTMIDSTVDGNAVSLKGGALYLQDTTATLTNCTFSGNSAADSQGGGGIHNIATNGNTGLLTLMNCTVAGNTSTGGAIRTQNNGGAVSVVTKFMNTLVADNTGNNFVSSGTNASLTSQGNNLDSDGTSGFTNGVNGDLVGTSANKIKALLSTLGSYGGTTQTHALLPSSPAINAGTSTDAPTNDQRGSSRVGAVDIGAFESQGFMLTVASGNNQSATISSAFANPLSAMVTANVAAEPVNGGQVSFTPPASGVSAVIAGTPASIASGAATSGTVTANSTPGSYNVVASANGASSINFSLTNGCQTITVNNPLVSTGTPGVAFSQTFTQSGGIGNITFSKTGTLPTGITLSTDGVLSGTTNQTGVFPIIVTATDANGCTGTGTAYPLTIYTSSMLGPAPTPELLHYKFDGTGTTVPNLASNPPSGTANATLMGSLTQGGGTDLCPATTGGALIGTGGNGASDYLNTGWATNLTGTSWTISFKTSNISHNVAAFYMFGDTTANSLRCFAEGTAGSGNWLLRGNGMTDVLITGAGTSVTTTTFVYDSKASTIKAYVNGNLVNTVAQGALSLTGTGPFKVSGYGSNVGLPNGGKMDDFRVYNRALTELEVLSISNCVVTNAPTITPIAQTVSQGSSQTLPIATVNDVETPAGNLIVTATSVPAGISVTGIINSAGNVSALLAADCSATVGNYTVALTVSDGKGRTATGNLILTVTANTAPSLSYPASTIGLGGSTSITPTTATDNGSITGYSIVSITPAMTVAPTVNASGVVSISNAGPLGSHTIVIQATDNCGATTNASFTVNVVTCSSITVSPTALLNGLTGVSYAQTLTATGGSGAYTFSLASGNLPAGLGLSGNMIVGIPTTAGASTFTIRATDTNTCFGERTYTVVIGSTGLMYYPLARPVRLLDTRNGASPNACNQPNAQITGGTSLTITARGTCDGVTIPANATTLTGNVTIVQPTANGFLTLFPSDVPQPTVASTNFLAGEVLNNAFTAGIGTKDGAIKIFASATTHVVMDITGYYAPPTTGGLYFHPLPKPIRLLETRQGFTGCQATGTPLQAGSTRLQTGVLTCDGVTIPTGAQALVGNATTTNTTSNGYLTLYPADATQPFTANSNFVTGVNRNAPFTVGLSLNGEFNIFTAATTDLVIDVMGYYSAQASDTNGQGLLFNSLGSPLRLMDTRAGQSACYTPGAQMTGGTVYTQETQTPCSNLTSTARGLVGNVSTVNAAANGFVTFWPSNAAQPNVATSNYQTGRVFNRHFTVGLGTDAAFKRFTASTTDLIIDISGFFAP